MITIKVTFSDGDYLTTRFNGTMADANQYYIGKVFNLGTVSDKMVKAIEVEQI